MPVDIQCIIGLATVFMAGVYSHEEVIYKNVDELLQKKNEWLFRVFAVNLVIYIYILVMECKIGIIIFTVILAVIARLFLTKETKKYMQQQQENLKRTKELYVQRKLKEIIGDFSHEELNQKKEVLLKFLVRYKNLQEEVQELFCEAVKDGIPERKKMKFQELRKTFYILVRQRKAFEKEIIEAFEFVSIRIRVAESTVDKYIPKIQELLEKVEKDLLGIEEDIKAYKRKLNKK